MSVEQSEVGGAQKREVLERLQETDRSPEVLEAFEESDLERMIRDVSDVNCKKTQTRKS